VLLECGGSLGLGSRINAIVYAVVVEDRKLGDLGRQGYPEPALRAQRAGALFWLKGRRSGAAQGSSSNTRLLVAAMDGPHRVRRRVEADQIVGLGDLDLGLELGQVVKRHDAGPTDPEAPRSCLTICATSSEFLTLMAEAVMLRPSSRKASVVCLVPRPSPNATMWIGRSGPPSKRQLSICPLRICLSFASDTARTGLSGLTGNATRDSVMRIPAGGHTEDPAAPFATAQGRGQRRRYHGQIGFTLEQGKQPAARVSTVRFSLWPVSDSILSRYGVITSLAKPAEPWMDRVSADAAPAHKTRHPMPAAAADTERRNEISLDVSWSGTDAANQPSACHEGFKID